MALRAGSGVMPARSLFVVVCFGTISLPELVVGQNRKMVKCQDDDAQATAEALKYGFHVYGCQELAALCTMTLAEPIMKRACPQTCGFCFDEGDDYAPDVYQYGYFDYYYNDAGAKMRKRSDTPAKQQVQCVRPADDASSSVWNAHMACLKEKCENYDTHICQTVVSRWGCGARWSDVNSDEADTTLTVADVCPMACSNCQGTPTPTIVAIRQEMTLYGEVEDVYIKTNCDSSKTWAYVTFATSDAAAAAEAVTPHMVGSYWGNPKDFGEVKVCSADSTTDLACDPLCVQSFVMSNTADNCATLLAESNTASQNSIVTAEIKSGCATTQCIQAVKDYCTGEAANGPSFSLQQDPTVAPTLVPTSTPTQPTVAPTSTPTIVPSAAPTIAPTIAPTSTPTLVPSAAPTTAPTTVPTSAPTA